jgi:hypothetical protein
MTDQSDVIQLMEEVFGEYPGSVLIEPLKDGACLQATIDGRKVKAEKRGRSLVITEGELESPDITVKMSRDAAEYMAESARPEEFVERARECINGTYEGLYMDYEINAGLTRMLMKGYFDFARVLRII